MLLKPSGDHVSVYPIRSTRPSLRVDATFGNGYWFLEIFTRSRSYPLWGAEEKAEKWGQASWLAAELAETHTKEASETSLGEKEYTAAWYHPSSAVLARTGSLLSQALPWHTRTTLTKGFK